MLGVQKFICIPQHYKMLLVWYVFNPSLDIYFPIKISSLTLAQSWRSLTKAVMLKAEIIGPKYKSRGWVEQEHSWKTCNCINIGRELVLYEDIELLVHDMEIIEDASWNSSIEDASWNSRQDSLETMEIRTLEQAKAAIRFAAAGILTTIDLLHFNPFECENDDIASLENIDLLVKITKNELLNLSKNFINHFSHIHCTLLEVKF